MLVVSRRAGEDLIFPKLGIVVRVLKVSGRLVKVGVDAPTSVKVLRAEMGLSPDDGPREDDQPSSPSRHDLRNQLNGLMLKLQILQMHLDRGSLEEAEELLEQIVRDAEASEGHGEDPRSPAVAPSLHNAVARRILAVEDSDNERMLLSYLLVASGFDVSVARDGQEAIEILLQSSVLPDYVLMDLNMPMCNGIEALAQIRSHARLRKLRVFAVTGEELQRDSSPAEEGWDGWFAKPINVPDLISSLDDSSDQTSHRLRTTIH